MDDINDFAELDQDQLDLLQDIHDFELAVMQEAADITFCLPCQADVLPPGLPSDKLLAA